MSGVTLCDLSLTPSDLVFRLVAVSTTSGAGLLYGLVIVTVTRGRPPGHHLSAAGH